MNFDKGEAGIGEKTGETVGYKSFYELPGEGKIKSGRLDMGLPRLWKIAANQDGKINAALYQHAATVVKLTVPTPEFKVPVVEFKLPTREFDGSGGE